MIYKLLILIKINDNIHIIDEILSDELEHLQELAKSRQQNNPEYIMVLMTFKLNTAKIFNLKNL